MTVPAEAGLVDGMDVDAIAAAVRGCPAVDDLDGGPFSGVATYLPGRRVPGIRIFEGRVEIHVRGAWNVPVATIASQVRRALAKLTGDRPIDIVLTDIVVPGQAEVPGQADQPGETGPGEAVAGLASSSAGSPSGGRVPAGGTVESWTTPSASDGPSGASTSAPTIPTAAEIRPNS